MSNSVVTNVKRWQTFTSPNGLSLSICVDDTEAFGIDVISQAMARMTVYLKSGNTITREGPKADIIEMHRLFFKTCFGEFPA